MILGTCSFGLHQQSNGSVGYIPMIAINGWKSENAICIPQKNRILGVPYFQTNPNIYGSVGVCNEIYGFVHISLQPIPEWGERLEFYTIYPHPLKTLKEWEFPKSKRQNGSGLKPKTLGNSWFLIVQYQTSICQQNSTYTRQGLGSSLISPWS